MWKGQGGTISRQRIPYRIFAADCPKVLWRGAILLLHKPRLYVISIHASRTGSDGLSSRAGSCPCHFNPRPRVGSDQAVHILGQLLLRISIHTPTWGATFAWVGKPCTMAYFNPRSHTGSDCKNRQNRTDRIRVFTQTFIQTSISHLLIMQ